VQKLHHLDLRRAASVSSVAPLLLRHLHLKLLKVDLLSAIDVALLLYLRA
jgi:hypothetical protein